MNAKKDANYSLRRRLLVGLLAALAAIAALALVDTWREAGQTSDAVSDRVLAGSALAIAERVVVSETGSLEVDIPYVALEMLTSSAQDRVFYRVDGPPGAFITGYEQLPVLPTPAQDSTVFGDAVFRGEAIRLATLARSASTGAASIPYVVTVAETTIARSQLAQTILLRSALRLGILVLAATAIIWFAVTISLRPLYRLRNDIATRSPDDLKPIARDVPNEVRDLVDTLNSFMDRLGGAIAGLRNFTGNASHQLRTPMAIMRTQLALAERAGTTGEALHAVQTADDAVVQAERVLAQLLLMARVEEASSHRLAMEHTVDLNEVAEACVTERVVEADALGIDLGYEAAGPSMVRGERLLLTEMVRNLVSNALNYAGRDAIVTVRVTNGAQSVLEVEDNGPGIAPAEMKRVRERFSRGDGGKPGAGLGIPVVEEIANLFGGTLALETGPGGRGLLARLSFPRA